VQVDAAVLRARQGQRAGGLDDDLHALGIEAQRRHQLLVGGGDDVRHVALDDGKGDLAGRLGLRAVGDGARRVDAHDAAGTQRLLHVVAGGGLHADHLALGRQGLGRQQAAREQAAAAQADEEVVQIGHLLQQLQRCRALAGDDVRMVEGRHQGHAALFGQAAADGLAVVGEAVEGDHLGAVFPRGGDLGCGRVLGHDDQGRHIEQARRQRDGLRVVARREGQHAAFALRIAEAAERVVGAAELEGAHALQVLALEEELRAQLGIGRAGAQHRRAVRHPLQPTGGIGDVVEGGRGERVHGGVLWMRGARKRAVRSMIRLRPGIG